jgi:signal transduction histidine kinase
VGIGLTLSKLIIEQLGGHVHAQAAAGAGGDWGNEFVLSLPTE